MLRSDWEGFEHLKLYMDVCAKILTIDKYADYIAVKQALPAHSQENILSFYRNRQSIQSNIRKRIWKSVNESLETDISLLDKTIDDLQKEYGMLEGMA